MVVLSRGATLRTTLIVAGSLLLAGVEIAVTLQVRAGINWA
jgi:hypothetical protein